VEKDSVGIKEAMEVVGRSGRGDRRERVARTREGSPRAKELGSITIQEGRKYGLLTTIHLLLQEGRKDGQVKVGVRLEEEGEENEEDEGTGQAQWGWQEIMQGKEAPRIIAIRKVNCPSRATKGHNEATQSPRRFRAKEGKYEAQQLRERNQSGIPQMDAKETTETRKWEGRIGVERNWNPLGNPGGER
jgi:hypothetical protein